MRKARLWSEQHPHYKSDHRDDDHRRHEPGGHAIGHPLNRSPAALRLAHQPHDLRQQCLAAHVVGAHDERPSAVDRPANHPRACFLRRGERFPADHRLVYAAGSFQDDAIHGNLFARPHAQPIPWLHLLEGHVLFPAIAQQPRSFGSQIEQRPNGGSGPAPRPQFQNLPQQNQCRDGRGGLKVNFGFAAHPAERPGKDCWEQGSHQAVRIRHARAHGDEREHIGGALDDRSPPALKERRTSPEHDGSGQDEFEPRQPISAVQPLSVDC